MSDCGRIASPGAAWLGEDTIISAGMPYKHERKNDFDEVLDEACREDSD